MAASASCAVLATFSPISVVTGRRLRIDVPRSPRRRRCHEAAVLLQDGLVQVELRAHLRHLVGIGDELGQHHLDRVAGHQEQHAEDRQRHAEQDGDDGEDPPQDPRQHGRRPSRLLAQRRVTQDGIGVEVVLHPLHAARNAHTDSSSTSGT
jgi:hypothetical protein